MIVYETLAQVLQGAGLGVYQQDIFVNRAPKGGCITLRPTTSPVDPELPTLRRLSFQLVVTSPTFENGWNRAEAAKNTLRIRQQEIGSAYFYRVDPDHEVLPIGREAADEETFVVNFTGIWRTI